MKEKDFRFIVSEKIIKDTYLELLESYEPNKISVKLLCEKAKINRGTFYNHFLNIDGIYASIAEDFFKEIKERLDSVVITSLDASFFEEMLSYIKKEKTIFKLLLKEELGSPVIVEIIKYLKFRFKDEYVSLLNIEDDTIEDFLNFMFFGSMSLILNWAKSNFKKPIREVSNKIAGFNIAIIEKFYNEKNIKLIIK